MAFVNNFSTSFRWFDRLFGTDDKYRVYRARIQAAKKVGMTPDEFKIVEARLCAEAEKEGVEAEKVVEAYQYGSKTKVA